MKIIVNGRKLAKEIKEKVEEELREGGDMFQAALRGSWRATGEMPEIRISGK